MTREGKDLAGRYVNVQKEHEYLNHACITKYLPVHWYVGHTGKIPNSHKDVGRMAAMADPFLDALMR